MEDKANVFAGHRRLHCASLIGVLLVCWLLLNLDLEVKSLWTDELFTAEWTRLPVGDLVRQTADDFHPPLYFLLTRLWCGSAGHSDFALRWPSVIAGWLSVAVLYRLTRSWGGRRIGLLCATMWACSPVLILYARMARYYALTALLALLATYALWRALARDDGDRSKWIAYVAASWAAVFTFYLSGLLLLAHGCLAYWMRGRRGLLSWFLSLLAVLGLLLPWAGVAAHQTSRTGSGAADLAFGAAGFLMKVGYTAYAFLVGESLFPWRPLALAGAVCGLLLFGLSIMGWRRRRLALPLLGLLLIPLLILTLLIALVSPRTPFVSMPARALFVAPYFFAIVSGAALHVRRRWLVPALAVIGATWGVGLSDYYHDVDFLNPIYLTPAKQMVAFVQPRLEAGDIIYSDWDSGFDYYFQQTGTVANSFTLPKEAIAHLEDAQAERVWLVALGRDQSQSYVGDSLAVSQWLDDHFTRTGMWGFVPQDEQYRLIKSHLLGRDAFKYRATVSLYVR